MDSRFYISKIRIEGENKKTVNIELSKGLNVILGSSDCGKSHLYKIIYFVLGGSKAPDEEQTIPESKGYDTYYLEITGKNKVYTLKRNRISKSKLYIYDTDIIGINDKTKVKDITNSKISSELLKKLGIKERKILHRLDKIGNLTISNYKKLFFVNEDDVSAENQSPILSVQHTEAARGRSIFKCFLDDSDYSSFNNQTSNEILETSQQYTKEYIKTLLNEAEKRQKAFEEEIKDLDTNILNITKVYKRRDEIKNIITNFEIEINCLTEEKKKLNDKLQQNQILYNRFLLLKEYCDNDLKRIDFIKEGNKQFNNLKDLNCPLCGCTTEKKEIVNYEAVEQAVNYERNKILTNLNDLNKSIDDVISDIDLLKKEIIVIDDKINKQLDNYKFNIEPELIKNEAIIAKYIDTQILIKNKENNEQLIKRFKYDINNIKDIIIPEDEQINKLTLKDILSSEETTNKISLLEKEIQSLIKEWEIKLDKDSKLQNELAVEFDTDICDIKVNGRPRRSFGQGVRAILYTAFLVGFLQYCIKNNLQHPGFTVIDSPLTTYKKHKIKNGKNEDLKKETHQLFYESLSKLIDEQIIIIENSDKYPENIFNINIVDLEDGLFPASNHS